MPYKRPKTFDVKLNEKDKQLLETLAKRHKLSQKMIVGYLIELCDNHNLLAGDWKARLDNLDDKRAQYTALDGSCPALTFGENHFICLWGQDGKPPASKRLAREIDEALDMCAACNKTLKIKLDNESYQAKIQELEMKLRAKADAVFKVPACMKGSRVNDDCTEFENCPRNYGRAVNILGYCKAINDKRGCDFLKFVVVGAETKLK